MSALAPSLSFGLGLAVERLEVVRGQKRLFSDLSFEVAPGRLLVVRGANGSGKTSLIRTLAGLAAPASGEIVWHEAGSGGTQRGDLGGNPVEDGRARIAYVAHHPAVHPVFTARGNLRYGLELLGSAADDADVDRLFKRLGLPARLPAANLSQGQQRRLALAQLTLAGRPAWLLDEPLTALDDAAVGWFRDALAQHLAAGGLCVMSLHQDFAWHSGQSEVIRLTRAPKTSTAPTASLSPPAVTSAAAGISPARGAAVRALAGAA